MHGGWAFVRVFFFENAFCGEKIKNVYMVQAIMKCGLFTIILLVFQIIACNEVQKQNVGEKKIQYDTIKKNDDYAKIKAYDDSLSLTTFKEIIEKIGYENLELSKRQDTVYRLFISGSFGVLAQIITVEKQEERLKITDAICFQRNGQKHKKVKKKFSLENKFIGETREYVFIENSKKRLSSERSSILLKQIKELSICKLKDVKPPRRGIVMDGSVYYLEELAGGNYCILTREDGQDIEKNVLVAFSEIEKVAK